MKRFLFLFLILSFNISAGEKTVAEWIQDKLYKNNLEEVLNSGLIPLERIAPKYPREALKAEKTGFVTVRLTVDEKGSVISAIIEESRPPNIFDDATIQALLKWKFKPRVIDGVPVKQVGLTTIEFNL
tara:strand:- start:3448 stop:3831 length:384 start_codon:yes stop_codon:yes gene_type:complete